MKKHLMILGDVRIGDCIHVGTFLNHLKKDYETTWVHGTYEREPVQFLKKHTDTNIVDTIEKPSTCRPFPTDLQSIESFIKKFEGQFDKKKYDLVTANTGPIFFKKGDPILYTLKGVQAHKDTEPYVCTHTSSISIWKDFEFLYRMGFGVKNYGLGLKKMICHGAVNKTDIRMDETASLLLGAKCMIGIHSSMACLAFHLGTPLVCLHFWKGGATIKFGDFRDKCVDLIEPTEANVLEAVRRFL